MTASLPLRHFLLALAVVAVWGSNFVVIKVALDDFPPLLFAALRFVLVFLPAAFFFRRPAVALGNLALYGILIGVGQFGLLYIAMNGLISPGIASLVIQSQVFFTIGMAAWLAGERIRGYQYVSLMLAASGIAFILYHTDGTTTAAGLALVLCAALAWAGANLAAKIGGPSNMMAYVVWSGAFTVPPLLALSLLLEGAPAIEHALGQATVYSWLAVAWQSWGNTLFGYVAWGWLLARYPMATIAPMALLVPIFGLGTSALLLAEPLPAWKVIAASLVMTGLALNLLWPRRHGAAAQKRGS
ncbi:EamA family transporter [Rhodocyclus tenuis]|uniref:EamA family transporter n=1 Tax=Rhodocyclus gracilis TaxID=2929842 RepID=A0ABX0WDZ7_9RHOO|nr:EamA family transporter [Rhodocyclus gracilis]NJA87956.1 EamA family transporter [Rhodocyclus gracilis]